MSCRVGAILLANVAQLCAASEAESDSVALVQMQVTADGDVARLADLQDCWKAIPGNTQSVTDAQCAPCSKQKWWPCDKPGLCHNECGGGGAPNPVPPPVPPPVRPRPAPVHRRRTLRRRAPAPVRRRRAPASVPRPSTCGKCTGVNNCYRKDWAAPCFQSDSKSACKNAGGCWASRGSSPSPAPPAPTPSPSPRPSPRPSPTPSPTFTSNNCVSVDVMTCINSYSTYWPKCNPNQLDKTSANAPPESYEFGHYCSEDWVNNLNEMLTDEGYCSNTDVKVRLLSQVGYETGFYSTVFQPRDSGSGLIHMIPGNFATNAKDMDHGTGSTKYQTAENAAGNNGADFFKDPRYGWKSVAAWFKRTNRVIPGCNINLFESSYADMTRCILSRVVDRSEIYDVVTKCFDKKMGESVSPTPTPTPTNLRCGSNWGDAQRGTAPACPSATDIDCPGSQKCFAI